MPDYTGFLRIGKMVSVLVSVADALPLKPLLHSQFGLEARVGIGLLRGRIRVKIAIFYMLVNQKVVTISG